MSATITIAEELDDDELSANEEFEEDELDSCDEDELDSWDELDGIGLAPDSTELDKEELLLIVAAAEVLAVTLDELTVFELELLDPPPPLLPPHAVSARLTTKSGSIF